MFAYLVLRGKVCLNPHFSNLSSSGMVAIGPGITSNEEELEFPVERRSKGSKAHSSSTQGGAYMELEQSSPEIDYLLFCKNRFLEIM